MTVAEAESEYLKALRLGQKECAMLRGKGQNPFPLVLDQILGGGVSEGAQDIGTLEIPIERIVGVKSAGRISAFSAGFFPLLLAPLGHEVTGVDLSEKMVQEARKNCLAAGVPARFRKMDAQALDFADESFDVILSRNLTWTLPDVMEAYREWHRVLRPQGILLNFDSDYGCKTFTKTKDADHVHASLSQETLTACNDIKHQLHISQHRRPFWDARFLDSLGMEVSVDADIAPRVQRDPSMHYDDVAVFGIHAKKSS